MTMFNPPHPGETLREDVLPALGLTVSEAAQQLGVSRVTLSRVLNGKAAISIDLARRLEIWLGGPEAWAGCRNVAQGPDEVRPLESTPAGRAREYPCSGLSYGELLSAPGEVGC